MIDINALDKAALARAADAIKSHVSTDPAWAAEKAVYVYLAVVLHGPEVVERVARSILKVRYYDCDADMYDGLDEFWASMNGDHHDFMPDARAEASAVIAAIHPYASTEATKE